jgi:autotransporter-associated beta strand protein
VVNGGTVNLSGANNANSGVGCANMALNNGGTVSVNADNAIGATGLSSITLNNGGTLTLGPGVTTWLAQGGTLTLAGGNLGSADSGNATYGTWTFYDTQMNVTDNSTLSAQKMDIFSASHPLTISVAATKTLNVSGFFGPFSGGLILNGSGTCLLSGANTYSGPTTVSNGTLVVTGSITGSPVTVVGGTLAGTGTLGGATVVQTAGTLMPGSASTIGTLTFNNTLGLAGQTVLALDRNNAQTASKVTGVAALSAGSALVVANIGAALQGGDAFTLFSAAPTGAFGTVNLPALNPGQNWWTTNNYATLTVNQVNAPTATYARAKDTTLKILIADLMTNVTSQPAGADTFTLVATAANSANGAAISNDGLYLLYAPVSNLDDSFSYTVTDARGGSATGTVTIHVISSIGPALGTNCLSLVGGTATVSAFGIPGYDYALQTATNLGGPWWPIATNRTAANGLLNFTDPNATNAQQYYRLAQP